MVNGPTVESLWHFTLSQHVHAESMRYLAGRRQYFAVAAGNGLFTFALPEPETAPVSRAVVPASRERE